MGNIKIIKSVLLLFLPILFFSCSKIDKDKFSNLYHTANDIEGAIKVGINYGDFGRLLQKYSSGKELIDTTELNDDEIKLYQLFDELFILYSHSHIIWNLDTEFTFENWSRFPREFIRYEEYPHYENEKVLKSLIRIYDLEIEKAVFKPFYDIEAVKEMDAVNRKKAINKIWSTSSKLFSEIKKTYNE